MHVLNKSIALVRQNIDIFNFSPQPEMSQQNLIQLGDTVVIARQSELTYVNGPRFFRKRSHAFHVLPKCTEPGSTENILRLVHCFALLNCGNSMIVFTVDSVGAASPCEKKAEVCSTFLVEQIRCCVPDVQLGITAGQCSLFFLLVLGADVLAIPKIVFFVSFFVSIVVGQACFHLFSGRLLFSVSELQVFQLFLFCEFLRDVTMQIELGIAFGSKSGQVCLDSHVQLLGQLPDRLACLGVEVVVLLVLVVVVYLEGLYKFVDFLGVHVLKLFIFRSLIMTYFELYIMHWYKLKSSTF